LDSSLTQIVLLALSFSVAFNLFLTLRLIAIVGAGRARLPFSVVIGERLPNFHGKVYSNGRLMTSGELLGQAAVLVFLSAGCDKCMARIPELKQISHAMERLGVPLWVIAVDSTRNIARHLEDSVLLQKILVLDLLTRQALNPGSAAPFYIFVDHGGTVQARDLIGDENWLLFTRQLHEDQTRIETGQ
jgi:hypothetical protein